MNSERDLPIGIFDSGVGGLTVYGALHAALPREHFVYLGDTARIPYGTKSLATVERYAVENSRFLDSHGIKLLVVACNTASALALPAIRDGVNVDVIGVIEPGANAAIAASASGRIGVIATEATVQSRAYSNAIARLDRSAVVIETACPLFVSLAEEGWANSNEARSIAATYLEEINRSDIDTLVMGCTHYPILQDVIQETVGDDVRLIDSGEAAALYVATLLETKELARRSEAAQVGERRLCDDLDHFYVTDAAARFARVAEMFLGSAPSVLEAIEIWGDDELRSK